MKIKVNRFAAGYLAAFLLCVGCGSLRAQSRTDTLNTLSPKERKQGFQLLFNGTDLGGWRAIGTDKPPAKGWVVENGVLHVLASKEGYAGRGGDIVTVQKFDFFELTFDFRITEGANSGVKYFVMDSIATPGAGLGLEYQILDDEHHPDARLGRDGDRTQGSLYDLIPADKSDPRTRKPIGEWNHGRIVASPDGHIQHWLNGVKVLEYTRGSDRFNDLVAHSKFAGIRGFGKPAVAPILLQDHGNSVYFANIKVRQLK
ncbi:MAG: DUF1080 domain-containing protein [Bacteroidota bacterium]|nr:DUF1080 domain-containing protein [Bacteroidota bacterium]MDP4215486.1 DUF1080 domain-containing protein [Bacteroidota bacterium]MDP4246720.1 DUF1080 domain-containing protein [Bacteroidota bacterium]MDP4252557.1 DUF1080 domain-containing protein [Bacteroidota bacterium]MDP4257807.1 DUF1080 domain-containing protein [Bacteroidota bacterium]